MPAFHHGAPDHSTRTGAASLGKVVVNIRHSTQHAAQMPNFKDGSERRLPPAESPDLVARSAIVHGAPAPGRDSAGIENSQQVLVARAAFHPAKSRRRPEVAASAMSWQGAARPDSGRNPPGEPAFGRGNQPFRPAKIDFRLQRPEIRPVSGPVISTVASSIASSAGEIAQPGSSSGAAAPPRPPRLLAQAEKSGGAVDPVLRPLARPWRACCRNRGRAARPQIRVSGGFRAIIRFKEPTRLYLSRQTIHSYQ